MNNKQSKIYSTNYLKKCNKSIQASQNNYYKRLKTTLDNTIPYTKTETAKRIAPIYKQFLGKSGNRKLIKHDIKLYKSIMLYGKEYDEYIKKPSFSVYITIAGECKYTIPRKYFCLCGKKICYEPDRQYLREKGYCKKCHITPNRKAHFQYKYEDNWLEEYNKFHKSDKMQKLYKEKGRKLIELKLQRGVDTFINKGARETDILDYYENILNINIDRDFKVLNYFPDGYCHETNTIYEVYEKHHLYPCHLLKDMERQHDIQKHLKCNFVIIYDNRDLDISQLEDEKHEYGIYKKHKKS